MAVKEKIKKLLKESEIAGILSILIVVGVVSSLLSGRFLTPYNISIIAYNLSFLGLVAIAQGSLLLMGDIDISIGAIAGLSSVITAILMINLGFNPVLTIIIGVALGGLLGAVNGGLITTFSLNPIVLTIGTQSAYRGINLVITEGNNITGFPGHIRALGGGKVFGIPIPALFLVGVLILFYFLTKKTTFGRRIYALGDNREAAKIVGVKVQKLRIIVYSLAGAIAGLAGILSSFRLAAAQSSIGGTWLLPSIAAPVIGGIAIKGGIGNIGGAVIGAALMAVIGNIIVLSGVGAFWQQVVNGAIIVLAIVIDSLTKKYSEA